MKVSYSRTWQSKSGRPESQLIQRFSCKAIVAELAAGLAVGRKPVPSKLTITRRVKA